jgi:excisionase family DNA binding protein
MKPKPVVNTAEVDRQLKSYGVRYVAEALSLHPETVRDCLRNGRIMGFRIGSHWRVRHDVLSDLLTKGVPLACDCHH